MKARKGRRAERRHYPRAHVGGSALVHAPGGVVRCEIADLSSHGALLRPAMAPGADLTPGMEVSVDLHPVGGRDWIGQRGRVRRCAGRGAPLAVAFDHVSPEFEDLVEDELLAELEALRTPRVLIVDRSVARRRPLVAALHRAGCCPLEASTPLEALGLIEASHDHLAAAVISGSLTQTGGPELAQFLLDTHPSIRIALVTAPGNGARARDRGPIQVLDLGDDPDWAGMVDRLLERHN